MLSGTKLSYGAILSDYATLRVGAILSGATASNAILSGATLSNDGATL